MSEPHATRVEPRQERRGARRAHLDAARRELAAASERGEGGRQALKQYSHRMDAMVQQLFAEAGPVSQPVGVYALGGYGRRELCLHSDIDLLVLFAGPIAQTDERFLHAFLNPLWDLGLTVGHHVREVHDGARLDADNPEFLLALTDARAGRGRRHAARSLHRAERIGAHVDPHASTRSGRSLPSGTPGSTTRCISSSPT